MLKKRTLATDVLAPMGEAEGDTDAIRNGLEAQYAIELPSFDTPESLTIWVNKRLENYLIKKTGDTPVSDEAQVVVRLRHSQSQSGSNSTHKSNRLIELFPDGPSRVETRRLEDGTLVTELGGAMLSLWPEAVLEPGDTVRVIA